MQVLIAEIPEEKEEYAYAENKWTVKEVIGHMIDTERVFGYRVMCFSRKDKTVLPGFDENLFIKNSSYNKQTLFGLANEFAALRESNLCMIKHFDTEMLEEVGNANGKDVQVSAIVYIMAGHVLHHVNVIKGKYLVD